MSKRTGQRVIFLDIDGVMVNRNSFKLPRLELAEHRLSYHTADPLCVRALNRIVAETGARVVVSSVWRGLGMSRIRDIFKAWELRAQVIGLTGEIRDAVRGDEIHAWLDANPDVQSFVILDDDNDMGQLKHRLVETDCMIGLTEADADRAIAILNAPPTVLCGSDVQRGLGMSDPVKCPYCNKAAELVGGEVIYPGYSQLHGSRFYLCRPCGAYVGTHAGTTRPLGRLANAELRKAKMAAHTAFDPLWKPQNGYRRMSRNAAYRWLTRQLRINREDCHIGEFDLETCQRVVEICREEVQA